MQQRNLTTEQAEREERDISEALAAVCAVALRELERSGLDHWAYEATRLDGADTKATRVAKRAQGLDSAVRILAAVADRETDLDVAAAVYLDPLDLLRIQREPWFDEDVLFFTDCMACGGQLVSVGGGDSAPSTCAACTDPDFVDESDEQRQGNLGHIARKLISAAHNHRDAIFGPVDIQAMKDEGARAGKASEMDGTIDRIAKIHKLQKRGAMTFEELVSEVTEVIIRDRREVLEAERSGSLGIAGDRTSQGWALVEVVGGIPDTLEVFADFYDAIGAFDKHLDELRASQRSFRLDEINRVPDEQVIAIGHWNFDDSELRLDPTTIQWGLGSSTSGESREHAQGGDMHHRRDFRVDTIFDGAVEDADYFETEEAARDQFGFYIQELAGDRGGETWKVLLYDERGQRPELLDSHEHEAEPLYEVELTYRFTMRAEDAPQAIEAAKDLLEVEGAIAYTHDTDVREVTDGNEGGNA